ncbi:MAG: chondroitinase-B domain-containing protein [Bacteroidota bacterium]
MNSLNQFTRGIISCFQLKAWMILTMMLLASAKLSAQTVTSLSALQNAIDNASAGAVITLANGTYTTSADIVITKQGTATAPITIQAQSIGGVTINGTAGFSVNSPAAYIVIKGFRFAHSASQATMASGTHHCRWTRNFFDTPGSGEYLQLNGNDHEIDYNTFQNKEDPGKFITVRGTGSQIAQGLWIHHNYFKTHLPGGGNGNESIQFGLSGYSLSNSNSVLEFNLFEDCDGENEGISVKASQVTLRYNTFRNNPAQFTLRHGNRCQVYGNYFVNTPGLRIFGDDHKIFSNHFENCNIALDIGNGDGEVADGAPLTSHDRPDRVLIAFNTLVNNTSNFHQGGRTNGLGASFITVANNIVQAGGAAADIAGPYTNATWSGNIIWNTSGGDMPSSGYTNVNPLIAPNAAGTYHLQSGSPAIGAATGSYPSVTVDMDGQARISPLDVGADEVSSATVTATILTASMVGQNGSNVSAPAAPGSLGASTVSDSQINLSWTDNSTNESNFRIERSTNGGASWSFLTDVNANTTTFSNTGLSAATTYHYRVRAENSGGNSSFSNVASATTLGGGTLQNVALNKTVTASGSDTNIPANAVDGNTTTRWSASPMPQWLEVDLGGLYDVSKTEVVSYLDRAYQFVVESKTTSGGSYTQIVNRGANTTPGSIASPITDNFTATTARYVRISISGASGYTGTWASLIEFRVFGVPTPALQNVALNKPVTASGSDTNVPSNAIDGNNLTRWSASPMPQWLEVDLGGLFDISKTEVICYQDRAYQFVVESKTTSGGSYTQVVNRSANITPGTIAAPIANTFSPIAARYVRISVNGASGYTGTWASLIEFRVYGVASGSGRITTRERAFDEERNETTSDNLMVGYPNPASEKVSINYTVKRDGNVQLTLYNSAQQQSFKIIDEFKNAGMHQCEVNLTALSKGIYFIRLTQSGQSSIRKLIKQ